MTAERIGRNDSIFRDANEQINAKAQEYDTDEEQAVPFICECADEHCTTIVPLVLGEYEDVRTDSRQFLTAFGHERFEGLLRLCPRITITSWCGSQVGRGISPRRWIDGRTAMERLTDRATIAVMDVREKRLGLNEAVFREVNDRITGLAKLLKWGEPEPLDLLCECRDATCIQRIEMRRTEYKAVRAVDTQFALYPGHADPEIERIVSSHKGYEVVAKQGDAAEVARNLSRR